MKAAAFAGLCALSLAGSAAAQSDPLIVAVAPSGPMASQAEDGRWTGPAIALMREAGGRDRSAHPFRLRPGPVECHLSGTARKPSADERGLTRRSAAVAGPSSGAGLLATLRAMATLQFLWIVLGLAFLLLIVGAACGRWSGGRRRDFRGEDGKTGGIGQGFWWRASP